MPQGLFLPNGLADAEPVAARHVHVAEDDLRDQLFGETEAAVAIRRGMDIPTALPKVSAERFAQFDVVVDQQNSLHPVLAQRAFQQPLDSARRPPRLPALSYPNR